jgi:hypothetical protein
VEVLLSADETFVKFHERRDEVLAPVGAKSVGSSVKVDNEKAGCTFMVTMEMISGQLLPPFVVHKGTFGGTLMKKWQMHKGSLVTFTKTHWMTEETAILYLQYATKLFPGKIIGLVWDHAPAHVAKSVEEWIDNFNSLMEAEGNRTRLVVEFVDNCLTSIYQPCDVVIIAILKKIIRRKYHEMLFQMVEDGSIAPGDTLKVTRETLTSWLEEAVEEINGKQADEGYYITKAFPKCGLDFRVEDYDKEYPAEFKKHLDSLSANCLYKSLTEAHEAAKLDEKAPSKTVITKFFNKK